MKFLTLILLSLLSSAVTADLSGAALVVDGNTIAISGMKVRLSGIDTQKRKQTCRKASVTWKCGYEAAETLRGWTYTKEVRCVGDTKDRYGRLIADCFVDGYNVNARLVYEGLALAYRKYSKRYIPEETAGANSHSARAAYSRQTVVDTTSCNWSLTSNGVRGTEDLVNRMAIVKLRKHPSDHQFKYGSKEGYHQHIRSNQSYYLGCVLTIVQRWIKDGKPKGATSGHSFITWAETLDYIVTKYFGYPPLMEGMAESKRSISDPNQSWVRLLCIAVAADDQLNAELSASELVDLICTSSNGADELPNGRALGSYPDSQQALALGRTLAKVRKIATKNIQPDMSVDGYTVSWEQTNKRGDVYLEHPQWFYTVTMDGTATTNEESCPF